MHHVIEQLKKIIRLGVFLLGLIPLLLFGNTFFTQTDSVAAMTMHEIREQSDAELAIVGSSMALYHMNPEIIGEAAGMKTVTAAITGLMPPGAKALTRELFRHASPEQIVLVLESGSFDTVKEDPMTQMKLAPHLSSPIDRMTYWLETAACDGDYAGRLLLMNTFGHQDAKDFAKTIRFRADHDGAARAAEREWAGEYAFHRGQLRIERADPVTEDTQDWFIRVETGNYYELMDQTRAWLREYRDLCEDNGAKLTVVIAPEMTVTMLREPERLTYLDSAQAFFAEEGIPCYNMLYAKESLLPDLNGYYYDYHHMLAEGADILSAAVGRVIAAHNAGEDISAHFCRNRYAYLAEIDFMTNVWATARRRDGRIALTADSNRGANVEAEYSFALLAPDGSETELRGYAPEAEFSLDPALVLPGSRVRVRGRAKGSSDAFRYDLTLDGEGQAL
ncbi:MAG: hypothetical protein J6M47_07980 [Clostridia bacterium]|nr:hypothetical protein [Clostridia bacterium]